MRRALLAIGLGLAPACSRLPAETTPVGASYPTFEVDRVAAAAAGEPGDPIDPYTAPGDGFTTATDSTDRQVGAFIPTPAQLGDPRTLELLRIDLRVGDYALPSSPAYEVERIVDGVQRVTARSMPGAVVTKADRDAALGATERLDVGTPRLRLAARDAVAGAGDVRAKAAALVDWVYAHITYDHVDSELASEVLDRRVGDCSEMSLLYVAMARAVGVPARRVVGLAATYEHDSFGFGYHAWAEVAIDGRWVAVDPTWNETLADATHIPLLVGDGDEWGAAAAVLELDVVEVKQIPGASGEVDMRELARQLPVHMRLRRR